MLNQSTGAGKSDGECARESDAAEWTAFGFSPEETNGYQRAWCFDARTAQELREAGITAELAAQQVGERDVDTIGHWVEIGAFTIEDAIAECTVCTVIIAPEEYLN